MNKTFLKYYGLPVLVSVLAMVTILYFDTPINPVVYLLTSAIVWCVPAVLMSKHISTTSVVVDNQADESFHGSTALRDLVSDMNSVLGKSISSLKTELGQVRSLIHDSVGNLNDSFYGLNQETGLQADIMLELVGRMREQSGLDNKDPGEYEPLVDAVDEAEQEGEEQEQELAETETREPEVISIHQFAEETSKILKLFIDVLVENSKHGMDVVTKIDDLSKELEGIFSVLSEIKTIADQTNLLALNAAIEAARAGDAGRGFAVVADEVRTLSLNSNKLNDEIKGQVEKAQSMIDETSEIVGSSASQDIMKVMNGKASVDGMLGSLIELENFLNVKIDNISDINHSISEKTNMAVRNLQFEDIIRQISQHAEAKIEKIWHFIEHVTSELCAIDNSKSLSEYEQHMNALREELEELSQGIEEKSVNTPAVQTSMSAGNVDLF